MALNPFFLQGSPNEQRLIQDLLNEQLTIYGVEVTYIPRKIINKDSIFTEVEASRFDDNFSIEAYVNTYEGYDGAGDIMTKFGVSLKDELTLTISKDYSNRFRERSVTQIKLYVSTIDISDSYSLSSNSICVLNSISSCYRHFLYTIFIVYYSKSFFQFSWRCISYSYT